MKSHAGQKYGDLPYFAHLFSVCALCCKYTDNETILSAAMLHDTLEDTEVKPKEIESINTELSEICILLSKNYNSNYFENIAKNPEASFVKMADRICNIRASLENNNQRMLKKYLNEMHEFQKLNNSLTSEMYVKEFLPLFSKMIVQINSFQIQPD